jgi:hypothetical protein
LGDIFLRPSKLQQAWRGYVAASFDDLGDEENEKERSGGQPLLEIYAPIRAQVQTKSLRLPNFMNAPSSSRPIFSKPNARLG